MSNTNKPSLKDFLLQRTNIDMIEDEIYLYEVNQNDREVFAYPIKSDMTFCCICMKGRLCGKIDLKNFEIEAPGLVIVQQGQIVEHGYYSNDFNGILIYMTPRFTQNFNLLMGHHLSMNIRSNPCVSLGNNEFASIKNYFETVRNTIRSTQNPYRTQILIHLTIAYFYGLGYYLHKLESNKVQSKKEQIATTYLNKVQELYKSERSVEFYAKQMQLNPNYLSHVVKEITGKAAGQWIDDYIILEAKALLKSTNMTIQEIANDLNFPSQSFFGKFFKRITGVAPKYY